MISRKNTIHREKYEIVLFTTRSYSVSHKGAEIPQLSQKTLFTDPMNSETTVNQEREKIEIRIEQS
jgi:hypothetical protein